MHYVAYAELAAAVSNAGGLGIITALTQPNPEALRNEIRKTRKLTNKPFGVNITLLPAMSPPDYPAFIRVIVEEKVGIVETAGHSPGKIIKTLKENGIIVIHKCTTIRHALAAQRLGVDILSIDGWDCAGHPSLTEEVGNFVLLAVAAKKLSIPFIASGGVGNGAQLAAALTLGAEGVNCGTLFMATEEAPIHPNIKKALVDGKEGDTTHIFKTLKNTERVFKNKQSAKVLEMEAAKPGDFQAVRPFVSGALYKKSFQETGDTQSSVWSCGPAMGLIDDIPSCQVLIERMVADAEYVLKDTVMRVCRSRL
eukprot:CAMPEP_0119124156 /NCGR_PEP_ID=MMETSP1310-20130426/3856_1 /TAXON_ID=464262 /ORGANISM="Genus nov. species nov., Strain RCC2339" /LENGTH=309 /DNA_ID=CAMNT_0007114055 /DNA_START=107 /DNA_END=1036 /DNA_ORIENTATION=+